MNSLRKAMEQAVDVALCCESERLRTPLLPLALGSAYRIRSWCLVAQSSLVRWALSG